MNQIDSIHTGEHLVEILDELGISQYRLAKAIGVPPRRINEIVHGRRSITADTALRIGQALTCMSHHPTAEAHDTTAMTSLHLLAVLDVLSSTPARAKRLAPRPDGPLTHFASPRGETCRLGMTPEFWLNLQKLYDLDLARSSIDIENIESLVAAS